MMTPEARETLLGACDKFAGSRGEDGLLKALRILSADTPGGTFARGLIQMSPSAPRGLTGEEIRAVAAGRLAELEDQS